MIGAEIRQKAGKKNRSGDWFISELETALGPLQDNNISSIDTGGIEIGNMFFFSYGAKYPEKYLFWDILVLHQTNILLNLLLVLLLTSSTSSSQW